MSYIGNQPSGQGQAERFIFTATGTTPTITHDDDSLPISYVVNHVSVYLNGVKQVIPTDVAASNGSTLVFAENLAVNDVVECIALSTFAAATTEGTSILSTGETGGTKFLREGGDNSSSWETVASGVDAADIGAGVLPSDVTGGAGLTALGTVATGNLSNSAIVYPAGHILQVKVFNGQASPGVAHSTTSETYQEAANTYWESDTYPNITVTAGNKIYASTQWMSLINGGGADSQGLFRIYDVTNATARGHKGNTYINNANAHDGYGNAYVNIDALWTQASTATIQFTFSLRAASGGTCQIWTDASSITLMEIQA